MNHLEYYVVYYLDRGSSTKPLRVTTINYLNKNDAEEKVNTLIKTEPNLINTPKIYEYRY